MTAPCKVLLRSGPGAWLRPNRPLLAWRPLLERTNRPSPTPPTVTFTLQSTSPQGRAPPSTAIHGAETPSAALEDHAAALAARLQELQAQVAALQVPRVTAAAAAVPNTAVEVQGGLEAAPRGQVVAYNQHHGLYGNGVCCCGWLP